MASRNVEIMRRAHEAFNHRDFEINLSVMAETATYREHARGITMEGREQFRQFLEAWSTAFTDGTITNAKYIDAGDTVVAQFTFEGINDGPYAGLPPTGQRVSCSICEIARFDPNGMAISVNLYYDQYTILMQLGHMKPIAAAA